MKLTKKQIWIGAGIISIIAGTGIYLYLKKKKNEKWDDAIQGDKSSASNTKTQTKTNTPSKTQPTTPTTPDVTKYKGEDYLTEIPYSVYKSVKGQYFLTPDSANQKAKEIHDKITAFFNVIEAVDIQPSLDKINTKMRVSQTSQAHKKLYGSDLKSFLTSKMKPAEYSKVIDAINKLRLN